MWNGERNTKRKKRLISLLLEYSFFQCYKTFLWNRKGEKRRRRIRIDFDYDDDDDDDYDDAKSYTKKFWNSKESKFWKKNLSNL